MPDPGAGFTRRSSSTLSAMQCPRYAYLRRMCGLRGRKPPGGWKGAWAVGSVVHSLMEMHLRPDDAVGMPMRGTDGEPVLGTQDDVYDYYVDKRGFSEEVVSQAKAAWERYIYTYSGDQGLCQRIVGRPEPNVDADLSVLVPDADGPIPYSARYDAIAYVEHGNGVEAIEHKTVTTFSRNVVDRHSGNGQIVGQHALWEARPDLQEKFGPFQGVLMNLIVRTGKLRAHRESVVVSSKQIRWFARQVGRMNAIIDENLARHEEATTLTSARRRVLVDAIWPQLGILHNQCQGAWGPCPMQEVCSTECVSAARYEAAEDGIALLTGDALFSVDSDLGTYTR